VNIKVSTLATLTIASHNVIPGGTAQFTAEGLDNTGTPIDTGALDWSVSGGGTISATGLFTSDGTTKGSFTVTATSHTTPVVTGQAGLLVADALVNICRFPEANLTSQYVGHPPNEDLPNVIDGSSSTKYLTFNNAGWIQVAFSQAYVVNGCALVSANDEPGRDPSSWTLEGSNDGVAWTTIMAKTGETFAGRLQRNETLFANNTAYSYFRLSMTASNTGLNILQLAEWELLSPNATTGVDNVRVLGNAFHLSASPNPFSGSTLVNFAVPVKQKVSIRLFDVQGRLVKTLLDGRTETGKRSVFFDGRGENGSRLRAGTYFCRIQAKGFDKTEKLVLTK
jgi:hypothetical protein